jgi:hypothetical protein
VIFAYYSYVNNLREGSFFVLLYCVVKYANIFYSCCRESSCSEFGNSRQRLFPTLESTLLYRPVGLIPERDFFATFGNTQDENQSTSTSVASVWSAYVALVAISVAIPIPVSVAVAIPVPIAIPIAVAIAVAVAVTIPITVAVAVIVTAFAFAIVLVDCCVPPCPLCLAKLSTMKKRLGLVFRGSMHGR